MYSTCKNVERNLIFSGLVNKNNKKTKTKTKKPCWLHKNANLIFKLYTVPITIDDTFEG